MAAYTTFTEQQIRSIDTWLNISPTKISDSVDLYSEGVFWYEYHSGSRCPSDRKLQSIGVTKFSFIVVYKELGVWYGMEFDDSIIFDQIVQLHNNNVGMSIETLFQLFVL